MTVTAHTPAAPLALPTIRDCFAALEAQFGLSPRHSQLRLAELVRNTLAGGGRAVFEAPTGTGKTLGYLAGALEQQAHSGDALPVVIATATVALQEQIMRDDVPRLEAAGVLPRGAAVIAKGRTRYFCPRQASLLDEKAARRPQLDLLGESVPVPEGAPIALSMLKSWQAREWDGDRDTWVGQAPGCWEKHCAATAETCVGRACDHRERCPYLLSRERMAKAKLIIANQDLVLADLAKREESTDKAVIPVKQYKLVVDEAHHFPEKALRTRQYKLHASEPDWLYALEGWFEQVVLLPKIKSGLLRAKIDPAMWTKGAQHLGAVFRQMHHKILTEGKFSSSEVWSWGAAAPATSIMDCVRAIAEGLLPFVEALEQVSKWLMEISEDKEGTAKLAVIKLMTDTAEMLQRIRSTQESAAHFWIGMDLIRWVSRHESDTGVRFALHGQPMEGAGVLADLLWNTRIPAVLVSASLRIGASFSRFLDKAGLPASTQTEALPAVFDYTRGALHLPTLRNEPSDEGYDAEVAHSLKLIYAANTAPGLLVLFTAREAMRRTLAMLPADLRQHALVADGAPIPDLIAKHKARIDAGGRSLLVGLDSLAEGLDLPGKYCGHVVITRLPFGVPGDPVEEARRAALKDRWFQEAYLADMLIALIQSTGRLIRRETDHGIITVLDKRLHTKRYGLQAYGALPPYTRKTSLAECKAFAEARGFDPSFGTTTKPAPTRNFTVIAGGKSATEPAAVAAQPIPAVAAVPAAPDAPAPVAKAAKPKKPKEPSTAALVSLRLRCFAADPQTGRKPGERILDWFARSYEQPARLDDFTADLLPIDRPCLPASAPREAWAEYMTPEARMLGLRYLQSPWTTKGAKPWVVLLRTRPDVLQFADILVSHVTGRPDTRTQAVSKEACESVLERAFAGIAEVPSVSQLEMAIEQLDQALTPYFESAAGYREPNEALINQMLEFGALWSQYQRDCAALQRQKEAPV